MQHVKSLLAILVFGQNWLTTFFGHWKFKFAKRISICTFKSFYQWNSKTKIASKNVTCCTIIVYDLYYIFHYTNYTIISLTLYSKFRLNQYINCQLNIFTTFRFIALSSSAVLNNLLLYPKCFYVPFSYCQIRWKSQCQIFS